MRLTYLEFKKEYLLRASKRYVELCESTIDIEDNVIITLDGAYNSFEFTVAIANHSTIETIMSEFPEIHFRSEIDISSEMITSFKRYRKLSSEDIDVLIKTGVLADVFNYAVKKIISNVRNKLNMNNIRMLSGLFTKVKSNIEIENLITILSSIKQTNSILIHNDNELSLNTIAKVSRSLLQLNTLLELGDAQMSADLETNLSLLMDLYSEDSLMFSANAILVTLAYISDYADTYISDIANESLYRFTLD